MRSLAGYTITQPSNGVIRLPPQATNRGLAWLLRPARDGAPIRLRADPADRFDAPTDASGVLAVTPSERGVLVRLESQPGLISVQPAR